MRIESLPTQFTPAFREHINNPDNGILDFSHVNGGVDLGNALSGVVPKAHQDIKKTINEGLYATPTKSLDKLTTEKFADAITPDDIDIDPYHGREPKRFLHLRKFILTKTVSMAGKDEERTGEDLATTWHLADSIKRNQGSRHIGAKSSVTHVTDSEGYLTGEQTSLRVDDISPTTRRQERKLKKLIKQHKKERGHNATHHHMETSYPYSGEVGSPKMASAQKKGRELAHHSHKKAHRHKEKFLGIVEKDAHRYRKAAAKRMRREAKLDAVEDAIAARP